MPFSCLVTLTFCVSFHLNHADISFENSPRQKVSNLEFGLKLAFVLTKNWKFHCVAAKKGMYLIGIKVCLNKHFSCPMVTSNDI